MRITVDPGHGGTDPGAVGPNKLTEASITLDIALRLERLLVAAGHVVKLTRTTDVFVELDQRAHIANMFDSDALISLHINAATNPAARGYEVWTTRGQTRADLLANTIFGGLAQAFPGEPGRRDLSDGDNDKEADYKVLRLTRAPAVLVEFGFISHPTSEAAMQSPSWREAAAGAVSVGLHRWIEKAAAHA